MDLSTLVTAAGVFSLGLGAWHIGVPRWFAFHAAIPGLFVVVATGAGV